MHPLRVAIIGAGPAGFYAAEHLLKQSEKTIEVDLFDRLPSPFGLVRFGVAPDHQKIKNVTRVFEKTASRPGFRFFGNVNYGIDFSVDDLRRMYHHVIFTTGAQVDRRLGIPGEDLRGSHSATEFVAWYNGHPDYRDRTFDLSQERIAIIGVGNVAIDVARILSRTVDELAKTDIADYALEALRECKVKEIYVLGRRGPAQAAFTLPEAKELGELDGTTTYTLPEETCLDHLSQEDLDRNPDRNTLKKIEILQNFASGPEEGKARRLCIRFLVSPTELLDDGAGHVAGLRLVRNCLIRLNDGRLRPRATEEEEILKAGLVFRSVGYRGVALPGVPFNERWGTVPHRSGAVVDSESGKAMTGLYVAGWIKRGPSGVIGTNKPDAIETTKQLLEDSCSNRYFHPEDTKPSAIETLLSNRNVRFFRFSEWKRLDDLETAAGRSQGRPRVKFTGVDEMLNALGQTTSSM